MRAPLPGGLPDGGRASMGGSSIHQMTQIHLAHWSPVPLDAGPRSAVP